MDATSCPSRSVVIVDRRPADYFPLVSYSRIDEYRLQFIGTGRAALRRLQLDAPYLWLINTRLDDVSGLDLAEMILSIAPQAGVFLVGDAFDCGDELRGLSLGVIKYACKPVDPTWLSEVRLPMQEEFPALLSAGSSYTSTR